MQGLGLLEMGATERPRVVTGKMTSETRRGLSARLAAHHPSARAFLERR
jgi:hypothetical protein